MTLASRVKTSYLNRLDELIREGEAIPLTSHSRVTGGSAITGETFRQHYQRVSLGEWVTWRTSCAAVMEQVVPARSTLRGIVDDFAKLDNTPATRERAIGFVKGVRRELEAGSLDSLVLQIEAETLADYLDQAQGLLDDPNEHFTFAAAAIVAGAALERSLRALCSNLDPPEALQDSKGRPLSLNGLIDIIKRREVFNELQAKELRTWSALRNHAAHGQFNQFSRAQVDAMVDGVRRFLASYVR